MGYLAIQISGQNMKVVRSSGQIIQGPQLVQGPLDHCTCVHRTPDNRLQGPIPNHRIFKKFGPDTLLFIWSRWDTRL